MTKHQTWNAEGYDRNARFVSDLGSEILRWLAAKPGEHILDLGCGDGALTKKIQDIGANVIGIDQSPDLLEAAIARGIDARPIDAREMDVRELRPDGKFDAVFSNAVLHWIPDADRILTRIRDVLKPGGRFVAEFGGHGNVAAIVTAMRAVGQMRGGDTDLAGPWFFPTVKEYRGKLEKAGFDVLRCELFARPTPLPTDMAGWLNTFRKPFFDQFEGAKRGQALSDVVELLRPVLCDKENIWTADYVRIRVEARL